MSAKHTSGPWRYHEKYEAIEDADGGIIADVFEPELGPVMAAAPELLRELEEAPIPSQYHGERGFEVERFLADYERWMAQRRAAIAKAKGEA